MMILQQFSFLKNGQVFGVKHVKLKYFIVKEEVQKQVVSIKCISTKVMIANLLTKRLSPKTFNDHVKHMGISGYHY